MTQYNNLGVRKPEIEIYLYTDSSGGTNHKPTVNITQFISKNYTEISKVLRVKFNKITKKNKNSAIKKNIQNLPALIYGNKLYEGEKQILHFLSSIFADLNYGYGNANPEELVYQMMLEEMEAGDDEPDLDDDRDQEIRRKMAAMQKRRPEMDGLHDRTPMKGGRKIKHKTQNKVFAEGGKGDDAFIKMAKTDVFNTDNFYNDNNEDDNILENYYLDEFYKEGFSKIGIKSKQ